MSYLELIEKITATFPAKGYLKTVRTDQSITTAVFWENGLDQFALCKEGQVENESGVYTGPLFKNLPLGIGELVKKDGTKISGYFNGPFVSDATVEFTDGSIYDGTLLKVDCDFLPHGMGDFNASDKSYRIEGTWLKGIISGPAIISFENHDFYEGPVDINHKPNGLGNMYYANGDYLFGEFRGGICDGYALKIFANGNNKAAIWYVDGKCFFASIFLSNGEQKDVIFSNDYGLVWADFYNKNCSELEKRNLDFSAVKALNILPVEL